MKKTILFIILIIAAGSLSCYDGLLETRHVYKLRDIGPAGGFIFYINPNYEKDGWRYLEAAPVDQSASMWNANILTGGTKTDIGTGSANTAKMSGVSHPPAEAARNYTLGGYHDWFLPSKDELDLMCWNLKGIRNNVNNPEVPAGGVCFFSPNPYWSSSEIDFNTAWCQYFSTGIPDSTTNNKGNNWFVRVIRAF